MGGGFAATNEALKLKPRRCEALSSIAEAVGLTPLVQVRRCLPELPGVELYAKLEWFNPGGSGKDRAARAIVDEALADGRLSSGRVLVEQAGRDLSVSYAMLGAARGFPVELVPGGPEDARRDRIAAAYGARPHAGCERARHSGPSDGFRPHHPINPSGHDAHARATAREIYDQTCGLLTHLVGALGASGALVGTARGLKSVAPAISAAGVEEPAGSADRRPDLSSLDETLAVSAEEAREWGARLAREDGLLAGRSAAAAFAGAVRIARRLAAEGRPGMIVVLFHSRADRDYQPAVTPEPLRPSCW